VIGGEPPKGVEQLAQQAITLALANSPKGEGAQRPNSPLASSIFLSSSCFLDGILRKVSLFEGVKSQEGVNKLRVQQIALLPALFLSSSDIFFAISALKVRSSVDSAETPLYSRLPAWLSWAYSLNFC
jgi:hypothetical protein